MTSMHVDLGFFDGDTLLTRGCFLVDAQGAVEDFSIFRLAHHLGPNSADIVLSEFADHLGLKTITLDMPIHDSSDWESIDLGKYTIAFRCRLEA